MGKSQTLLVVSSPLTGWWSLPRDADRAVLQDLRQLHSKPASCCMGGLLARHHYLHVSAYGEPNEEYRTHGRL
ncbi:hypothetical protein BQ8482_270022 [Mesorhizobium delmotii]|uniref:Uncharacterized protein n=1 Tax=Mesorhizobium delmotii TaxID=1631247 RepID=A0A2P9AMD4_9HYPH|nr:hypothetical protein BQ8482_270022 [Mesorhizobium delmotii]